MKIDRWLVQTHRWIGIVLCLFFAAWFVSGMVLMYVPYPSLSQQQLLQNTLEVAPSSLRVGPAQAIATAGRHTLDRLRIINRDGHPVYVLHPENERVFAIDAQTGKVADMGPAAAKRIANHFAGGEVIQLDADVEYDQWVVSNDFDPYRPFYRAHIDDAAGTVLYISQLSGEVVQRTRRAERGWNYLGAVVHWIYPTILRQHWMAWDQLVWWLGLAGTIGALIGIWLGIVRTQAALRIRGRGLSPFRGWLRWHHVMGLFIGVFVLTWIFSGWLSMDHGRLFSTPEPTDAFKREFRGTSLEQAVAPYSAELFSGMEPFREAEFTLINGKLLLVVRQAEGQRIYFPGNSDQAAVDELTEEQVLAAAQNVWPDKKVVSVGRLDDADAYGKLRAGSLPPTAIRVVYDDPAQTWLHVDAASGEILSVMDRSRRMYRWFFNGLHSLDIPGLANHRPWWDIIMLILLSLGFAFSLTGAIIGTRRLGLIAR